MKRSTLIILTIFLSLTACESRKFEEAMSKKPRNLNKDPLHRYSGSTLVEIDHHILDPYRQGGRVRVDPLTMEPYTGCVFHYYINWRTKKPTTQLQYKGLLIDGRREGVWEGWYENGVKKFEKGYKNNRWHGMVFTWLESGELVDECVYVNGESTNPCWWMPQRLLRISDDPRIDATRLSEKEINESRKRKKFPHKPNEREGCKHY